MSTDTLRAVRAWRTHYDMQSIQEHEQLPNMRHWYASHLKLRRWGYDAYRKQTREIERQLLQLGPMMKLVIPDDAS